VSATASAKSPPMSNALQPERLWQTYFVTPRFLHLVHQQRAVDVV
jgi:hypothetical protein